MLETSEELLRGSEAHDVKKHMDVERATHLRLHSTERSRDVPECAWPPRRSQAVEAEILRATPEEEVEESGHVGVERLDGSDRILCYNM